MVNIEVISTFYTQSKMKRQPHGGIAYIDVGKR